MSDTQQLVTQLEKIVLTRLQNNKLVLPTLPEAAIAALALMKDPDASPSNLASAIERDPLLAVQVLRTANSAAYGRAIASLDQAVIRLGFQRLKVILYEVCAHRVFVSREDRIAQLSMGIWKHSLAVALLSRDLVALSQGVEPEVAYLAGLIHDVGKPVMASILLEAEKQSSTSMSGPWMESADWIAAVRNSHRKIGIAIAEKWELPEATTQTIRDCGDYDPSNRKSPANYVRFANAVAKAEGFYYEGTPDMEEAQALVMIGRSLLGIDAELVKRLCSDLAARVDARLSS